MKGRFKKIYYFDLLYGYKGNIKNITNTSRSNRNSKLAETSLSSQIMKNKHSAYGKITLVNNFNKYFTNVGAILAATIHLVSQFFESYIKQLIFK